MNPLSPTYKKENGKYYRLFGYFRNDQPESQDSNFGEAWRRMLPYLPLLSSISPTTPLVVINRSNGLLQTTGVLNHKDFKCFTLELPWKNNAKNISCIPKGTYKCRYTFSPRFLKYTYEVLNVPNRSGIRIHSANFVSQLNGCIALGSSLQDINNDGSLDTTNSRNTIKSFEELMERKDFILRIT